MLDVEKLASRRFDAHPEDYTTANRHRVMLTREELTDFARVVARACARVADKVADEIHYERASGAKEAATAIRRAVRRKTRRT